MRRSRFLACAWGGLVALAACAPAAGQAIELSLPATRLLGKPLTWSEDRLLILRPDGQLAEVDPGQVIDYRLISPAFRPYTAGQMRGELLEEFGREYDVSGTQTFVVVHPAGQRDRWVQRFEDLYRSMHRYFVARGFAVERPQFPLVAVVFPSQQAFLRYAAREQIEGINRQTLGVYLAQSNRILMYDVTAGRTDEADWYVNAETIIHEAAHQTAFNLNIHRRLAVTPVWVVEGLGTMFEAPGVWNWADHPQQRDRVHRYQLERLRGLLPKGRSLEVLTRQIASDELFSENVELAYAHAWGLTFFLSEQEPRRYAGYLQELARRAPLEPYPESQRMADFAATFGPDLRQLDARMQRFLRGL